MKKKQQMCNPILHFSNNSELFRHFRSDCLAIDLQSPRILLLLF